MRSLFRVLSTLPLAAAGAAFAPLPAAAQGPRAEGGPAPLLRAVARMSCGTPIPQSYSLAAPGARRPGSGTYAPPPQIILVRAAELIGTLELTFGGAPRRGAADAERPPGGSWSMTPFGYCTGGRGTLQMAVVVPGEEGRPARFELRGPASRLQRPGARERAEAGEVRFVGTCGRRQQVVMEIWPAPSADTGEVRGEPERYYLVGNVTCAAASPPAAPADTTPTATP
jgi:hypothetical protein